MASTLPPLVALLLCDSKEFMTKMGEARLEMDAVSGKGASAFQGLASVGKAALLGIATAAVGVGAVSVRMASDFQASMEKLNTLAQVPQDQIAGLSDKVLALAGKVGTSPDSLAQALYHIESSFQSTGITGARAMDILKTAAEGARIGGSDLVDTTNALDATLVSGMVGADNYKLAMSAINAVVGSGDMTMQDMADAMKNGSIPMMKDFGVTLADAGAALATYGDNNIRGTDASTKLRMAVQAMAAPIKGGAAELAKLGMTQDQMAKDLQKGGLVAALEDLKSHMDKAGVKPNEYGEIITTVFGKKAGTGIPILLDQLDRLKSKYSDITGASTTFDQAWAHTQATFKQKWADLVASIDALAIRIGLWLIPQIERLGGFIGDVVKWFEKLVKWFEKHRTVTVELAAALGGILLVAIGAYTVSMIGAAAATLAALWPVVAVAAAVGALAAGVLYAYTHWRWFREAVQSVWQWMQGTLWPGLQAFARWVAVEFAAAVQWAGEAWRKIVPIVQQAWTAIRNAVVEAWSAVEAFVKPKLAEMRAWWDSHWTEIRTVLEATWAYIQFLVQTYMEIITTVINAALGAIGAAWRPAWSAMKDELTVVWDTIKFVISSAVTFIETTIGVFLDLITGHWSKAFNDMDAGTRNMLNNILDFLNGIVPAMYNAASHIGQAMVDGLVGAIKGGAGSVGGAVSGLLGAASPIGAVVSGIGDLLGRAGGGPVDAGTPYVVGENGPEIFVPQVGGTVVPNGGYGGSGSFSGSGAAAGQIVVNVTVQGNVVTNQDIVNGVYQGLLQMKRTRPLGLA